MKGKLISIGEASRLLGVSIDTLRRWDKSGQLRSFRPTATSKRYYRQEDIEFFAPQNPTVLAKRWAQAESAAPPTDFLYCQTRDIFQARLERMQTDLKNKGESETLIYLMAAVAGEIGNNSFDHNLGNWPDVPGVFFGYDLKSKQISLADRGQGILTTLRHTKPALKNDQQALQVAFTEIISGRAPESRGNGLKFVKAIVEANPLRLTFQSGDALLQLKQGDTKLLVKKTHPLVRGCLAVLYF